MKRAISLLACGLIIAYVSQAAATPLGHEFRANTTDIASEPAIASLKDGGFTVVWVNPVEPSAQVLAQRFTPKGQKIGSEIVVRMGDVNLRAPQVAGLENGGFVIVWSEKTSADPSSFTEILTSVFDEHGGNVVDSMQVNMKTEWRQEWPDVAKLRGGGFAVSWRHGNSDSIQQMRMQLFDAEARKIGREVNVNPQGTSVGYGSHPRIALLTDGNIMASWTTSAVGGRPIQAVYGQMFTSKGGRIGSPFRASYPPRVAPSLLGSDVAALEGRRAAFAWSTLIENAPTRGYDVFGSVFTEETIDREPAVFPVNRSTGGDQHGPTTCGLKAGGLAVAWEKAESVYYRTFDRGLAPLAEDLPANLLGNSAAEPAITCLKSGDIVIVWTNGIAGKGEIRGRRFTPGP